LPEVAKEGIHDSFQRNKIVLTWEAGKAEDGAIFSGMIKTYTIERCPFLKEHEYVELTLHLYLI
jgi:hypothetical protein